MSRHTRAHTRERGAARRRGSGALAAAVLAAAVAAACGPRARSGRTAPSLERPPAGADGAALVAWVEARRRACRGALILVYDEGPLADTGGAYRHRRSLAGVYCRPA
jgi:hypothetical protein